MGVINTDKLYEQVGDGDHRCRGCDAVGDRENFYHSPECLVLVLESLVLTASWHTLYRDRDNYICHRERTSTSWGNHTPSEFGESVGKEVWSNRGELGSSYDGCSLHLDLGEVCPAIAAEVEGAVNKVVEGGRKLQESKAAEINRQARVRSATHALATLRGLKDELRDEAYAKRMETLKDLYQDVWEFLPHK